MARIAGVDLPKNKRGLVALTYIYGVGPTTSKIVLDQAGMDEDALPAGHERVDRIVGDQVDLNRTGIDAGHLEDRLQVAPHQFLDLLVADEAQVVATLLRLRGRRKVGKLHQQQAERAEKREEGFEGVVHDVLITGFGQRPLHCEACYDVNNTAKA